MLNEIQGLIVNMIQIRDDSISEDCVKLLFDNIKEGQITDIYNLWCWTNNYDYLMDSCNEEDKEECHKRDTYKEARDLLITCLYALALNAVKDYKAPDWAKDEKKLDNF